MGGRPGALPREQLSTRGDSLTFSDSISAGSGLSAIALKDRQAKAASNVGGESSEHSIEVRELRVLQVFHGLGMGGAETWLMSLLKYFHEQNQKTALPVKFDVLLTGGERAIFDDEAEALGARLFYLPFTRRTLPRFVREFRRILANGNYDAIHDHQDYIAGLHFAMGAGHLPRIRIAHVHNPLLHISNYLRGPLRRFSSFTGKVLLSIFATDITGTSAQVLREYGFSQDRYPKTRLGAAHCGFDPRVYQGDRVATHEELCREFGWDDSAKIVLFVGRLEGAQSLYKGRLMSHKNPEFALDIVRECIARDSRFRFLMVGAGDNKRKEFQASVDDWGMEDKIKFLGVRPDVPRLMSGSNALLFPSLAEGLGMVVVEAQAAGLRVLASDTTPNECAVVADLIEFCPLDQTYTHWADRLLHTLDLSRPDLADCAAGVEDSAFAIENSAARLLELYERPN